MLFREGCHQSIGLSSGLPSFACMYVLAFSCRSYSDTEQVVALNVQNVCVHSLSFRCYLAFLGCGHIGLSLSVPVSVYLPSFQHCLYFAGASVNPSLFPIFSCNALSDSVSNQFCTNMSFYLF